jgi:hypothetical protein
LTKRLLVEHFCPTNEVLLKFEYELLVIFGQQLQLAQICTGSLWGRTLLYGGPFGVLDIFVRILPAGSMENKWSRRKHGFEVTSQVKNRWKAIGETKAFALPGLDRRVWA